MSDIRKFREFPFRDRPKSLRGSRAEASACLLTRRAVDRRRRWTRATGGGTMERHGLFGPTPQLLACLPRLALPVLRAASRCPRANGRSAYGGSRTLAAPPEPSGRPPARLGCVYAALSMGRADEAGLQDLLSRHPLEGGEPRHPPIYAVDVSVRPRCDAETSPERGCCSSPAATPPASPSLPAGHTNSWPSSASSATRGLRP